MSESAAAPGPPGAAGDPGSGPDLEILSKHILNATQLLLDAGDVESLKSLVQEKTDLLKKFASDPSCRGKNGKKLEKLKPVGHIYVFLLLILVVKHLWLRELSVAMAMTKKK